jgi:VIT1/CCC1 family predicted Fe2+/Mn2+ transporter
MPHLIPHHSHNEKHSGSSQAIRDIVVGLSDGLTVPFALAAGLTGAVSNNSLILLAGLAEIIAGTISMGLGGFLAGKTELDHYEGEFNREKREIAEIPNEEKEEIRQLLGNYGITPETQDKVALDLSKNPDLWVNFMMRFELGLEKPDPRQAYASAWRIGLSYAVGGLVPLLAYFLTSTPLAGLTYSSIITLVCLLLFGYWKARLTSQPPLRGALTVTFIGVLAAAAAFGLAHWIKG